MRAQSSDGTELCNCAEKEVKVSEKPSNQISIINKNGQDEICQGSDVIMKAAGELLDGTYWIWKENNRIISNEKEIVRKPNNASLYTLQVGSNSCKLSDSISSKTIYVYKRSKAPSQLIQKFDPDNPKISTLVLIGGQLAKESKWRYYYLNDKGEAVLLAETKEDKINVQRGWKDKKIYVKAVGDKCSDATQATNMNGNIEIKKRSIFSNSFGGFSLNYATAAKKWFHFGINAGIGYISLQDSIYKLNSTNQNLAQSINAFTYFFGATLHPIFLDQFYLGISGKYAQTFDNYSSLTEHKILNEDAEKSGFGYIVQYGIEMGWTVSREHAAKMFLKYQRSNFYNNLNYKTTEFDPILSNYVVRTYTNTKQIAIDRLSLGFRFGAYDSRGSSGEKGNPKLGRIWDLMIHIQNAEYYDAANPFSDFSSFSRIDSWQLSFGSKLWVHNALQMYVDVSLNRSIQELFSSSKQIGINFISLGIAYNFDIFR